MTHPIKRHPQAAAYAVITSAIKHLISQGTRSNDELHHLLIMTPATELKVILAGTVAASYLARPNVEQVLAEVDVLLHQFMGIRIW